MEPTSFAGDEDSDDGGSAESVPASEPTAAGDLPYAKPNLVLSDPDPYAFANRIRRLVVVFGLLVVLATGPYLTQQFSYHWRYGAKQADYDLAQEHLPEAAMRMVDFNRVSRLIADGVSPSVVRVSKEVPGRPGLISDEGSGVIIDADGLIVTNFHVIKNARSLIVNLDDGRSDQAGLVGADPATDLALLKINLPNLTPAEWGDSGELQVGDMVWALGSPFGLARSLTFGIVSAKERRSTNSTVRTSSIYQEYLQTDAAVNPGNSGGPLVNLEGKVVGINTAILGDDSFAGVSLAIPSNFAQQKIEQLRKTGRIERGFLGFAPRVVPDEVRVVFGLAKGEGVFVDRVERTGPASRAGIRRGDVILRWNDQPATDPTLLSREIAATSIGSDARVLIKRLVNGEPREVSVTVRVGGSPLNVQIAPER